MKKRAQRTETEELHHVRSQRAGVKSAGCLDSLLNACDQASPDSAVESSAEPEPLGAASTICVLAAKKKRPLVM